jgi:hypothetical protein
MLTFYLSFFAPFWSIVVISSISLIALILTIIICIKVKKSRKLAEKITFGLSKVDWPRK